MFRDQHVTWFNPDMHCRPPYWSTTVPRDLSCRADLTLFIATLPRSKYAPYSCCSEQRVPSCESDVYDVTKRNAKRGREPVRRRHWLFVYVTVALTAWLNTKCIGYTVNYYSSINVAQFHCISFEIDCLLSLLRWSVLFISLCWCNMHNSNRLCRRVKSRYKFCVTALSNPNHKH